MPTFIKVHKKDHTRQACAFVYKHWLRSAHLQIVVPDNLFQYLTFPSRHATKVMNPVHDVTSYVKDIQVLAELIGWIFCDVMVAGNDKESENQVQGKIFGWKYWAHIEVLVLWLLLRKSKIGIVRYNNPQSQVWKPKKVWANHLTQDLVHSLQWWLTKQSVNPTKELDLTPWWI